MDIRAASEEESHSMHVGAVIKRKGTNIVTVAPDQSIAEVVGLLSTNRIGAVLVVDSQGDIAGIISERDIVHGLSQHGVKVMDMKVGALMTRDVQRCDPHDTIANIMGVMTQRRIRHIPVVENGKLVGIISIGDVVKQRLDETEMEVETLREYVTGRG
jgi:CBS domain-containing protein